MEPIYFLKKYWKYNEFKKGQLFVIKNILSLKDMIVVFPTSYGKSLCYQLPSLIMNGVTIVICPLISLMRNQVLDLINKGISAYYITRFTSESVMKEIIDSIKNKNIKFLYLSPEYFTSKQVINLLKNININFICVDEAHCLYEWGFDFRVSYLKIQDTIKKLNKNICIIAFSGTLNIKSKNVIIKYLFFNRDPLFYQSNIIRENIIFNIKKISNGEEYSILNFFLLKNKSSRVIIFVNLKKQCFYIYKLLKKSNLNVDFFHSSIPDYDKKDKINRWLDNKIDIMVCTNSFGIGIHTNNVQFIYHIGVPFSLESYYQQASRGGRDGSLTTSICIYSDKDIEDRIKYIYNSYISKYNFTKIINSLFSYIGFTQYDMVDIVYNIDLNKFLYNSKLEYRHFIRIMKYLEFIDYISILNFNSSSLIKINYDIKHNVLLEFLKRKYPGIFNNYVNISESEIAYNLKITIPEVRNILFKMDKQNIIIYKSNLNFNIRIKKIRDTFFLKKTLNNFISLQNKYLKTFNQVRYFITQNKLCRQKLFAIYFGQKDYKICSKCDICNNNLV